MRSIDELIKDPDTRLIDVREPYEVDEVSVEGADNIPMADVPDRLEEIRKTEGDIVVFCRSGGRSESVVQFLKQNGIQNVVNGGGYADVQSHQQ